MIESKATELKKMATGTATDLKEFENTLRPLNLKDYIGQKNVKTGLNIAIESAKKRKENLDHTLLHGSAGLGKTTLAFIIAKELGVNMRLTSGPTLERQSDVASIISGLEENDVLFIDEIHRLKPVVEEVLYTAMEDYAIDIIIGKGPSARTMRINLPKFTLIGATTKLSMMSSPLRSRFSNNFKLQFYTEEDIAEIIFRSAKILNYKIEEEATKLLAKSARNTPRIANALLKRVRDFAIVRDHPVIKSVTVKETLNMIGIDHIGLDLVDREILSLIIEKFNGGPVGLNTLSAAINEEQATVEDIYEPFLIQMGFLERTPKGRIVTRKAYSHLGIAFNI